MAQRKGFLAETDTVNIVTGNTDSSCHSQDFFQLKSLRWKKKKKKEMVYLNKAEKKRSKSLIELLVALVSGHSRAQLEAQRDQTAQLQE